MQLSSALQLSHTPLPNSFPKVKLPVVGHFSCSYFEFNHIENCFFSLPTPSMNAVFSYELHLEVSYSSEVSSKCVFLWGYFFHILTSKVPNNLSRICFLWVSSNISSLVLDFATVSGSARRNFLKFIHQSHSLHSFQYFIP